jgi:hypothetical protein
MNMTPQLSMSILAMIDDAFVVDEGCAIFPPKTDAFNRMAGISWDAIAIRV